MKTKNKIMIIEDDVKIVNSFTSRLEKEGFLVHSEASGDKAILQIKRFKPDVILLDVLLPHKSGWEILDSIKVENEIKDTPVIMLSNIDSSEREEMALSSGAEGYIVKQTTPPRIFLQKIYSSIH